MRTHVILTLMLLSATAGAGYAQPGIGAGTSSRPAAARSTARIDADLVYASPGGRDLQLDLYRPQGEGSFPVVIWVHGGGWRHGDRSGARGKSGMLIRNGYAVVGVEYRLSGEAKFPAQIHDLKAAVRWLRAHAGEYQLDGDRIGAWGSSAGGHLVALLGTGGDVAELEGAEGTTGVSSRVQAVCDWFGPANLVTISRGRQAQATDAVSQLLGAAPEDCLAPATLASPVAHVSADDPPFLIMHGSADPLVPLRQSEVLEVALRDAGVSVELVTLEGAAHGGPEFMTEPMHLKIIGFFDQHLKRAETGAPPAG